jgi:glycosyltransferase involved in cell wall biosynthesis
VKILQVVPYFYPAWSYGGPAKLVHDLSQSLAKEGHQVTVYTSDAYDQNSRMPLKLRIKPQANLKIFYFPSLNNTWAYYWHVFVTPLAWIRMWWELPLFDVVHLHDFFTLQNFFLAELCRFWHVPYVINPHGTLEVKTLQQKKSVKTIIMKLVGLRLLKNASIVVASSDQEVKNFADLGVDDNKIKLIGHGIDLDELKSNLSTTQARQQFEIPQNKVVITFLGRLNQLKGLDMLLQVIEKTRALSVHYVIAGSDSGYQATIEKWLANKKYSNVTLLGVCAGATKANLFKASDIFIYPSYSEGFSLGILEAAGAGLPLIITQGCHFAHVAEVEAGLVTETSVEGLTEAVRKMVGHPELIKSKGKNAQGMIKKEFSAQKITQELLEIYTQAQSFFNHQ